MPGDTDCVRKVGCKQIVASHLQANSGGLSSESPAARKLDRSAKSPKLGRVTPLTRAVRFGPRSRTPSVRGSDMAYDDLCGLLFAVTVPSHLCLVLPFVLPRGIACSTHCLPDCFLEISVTLCSRHILLNPVVHVSHNGLPVGLVFWLSFSNLCAWL